MAESDKFLKRFWARIKPGKHGCLLWVGPRDSEQEYRGVYFRKRVWGAHRVAWLLKHGEIPKGLWVLHSCDTPACCNADHLFLGTQVDNMADMVAKGRSLHRYGELAPSSRLTSKQVTAIRKSYLTGKYSQPQLARKYGVTHILIGHIVRGNAWKHQDIQLIHRLRKYKRQGPHCPKGQNG